MPVSGPFVYTVSSLSQALKIHIESQFSVVKIRGEVSGAKLHTSGHLYFSLKDDQAVIAAVSWRGMVSRFPFKVQDGLEIICTGRLTTYGMQSKYQLIVDSVELAGQGSLQKIFEERKKKLESEGLFDESRKKKLPLLPKVIGIITSPTGAVIQDMLHRLQDRCPCYVILWPVLVQGPESANQIVAAIQGFQHLSIRPDVIIVARGGGSLEDLWSFNEESVARAVASCDIPIISGVGHEPDVTLIDYVADHRAPTPTAAMERAVPVAAQLLHSLALLDRRLTLHCLKMWEALSQRLDEVTLRLDQAHQAYLSYKEHFLHMTMLKLKHPRDVLDLKEMRLQSVEQTLRKNMIYVWEKKVTSCTHLSGLLHSYSVQKTLDRGFAIVLNDAGHVVSSGAQAPVGSGVKIKLKDSEINATILDFHVN